MSKERAHIVVGQGLAGSVLTLIMLKNGMNARVIDNGHLTSSSKVAAGMWNPISFVRLNETWMAAQQVEALFSIYPEFEKLLNTTFFHPTDLVRIFPDVRSSNLWDERSDRPEIKPYLTDKVDDQVVQQLNQSYGHSVLTKTGWLDVSEFLISTRSFLKQQQILIESEYNDDLESELKSQDPNCCIIFCTGWKQPSPNYFNWVNVIAHKGELLNIDCPKLKLDNMVNFGKFLLPLGDGKYKLGSTHELDALDLEPTKTALDELSVQMKSICDHEFKIDQHLTGFRPTMHDRKPVIGFHPENNDVAIFNGFGSRGVMLIPFFAQEFVNHLLTGAPLRRDVDVRRYWKGVK